MKAPAYRPLLATGIFHFGPGAFHRAHQADYLDRLAADDPRWGIAAASLRSRGTIDSLRRQDGLYTLAILDSETRFRTIGVHTRLFGPGDSAGIRRQLLDPCVRIVSSTVTEKGYCLAGDGTLDQDHPDIVHDLARPNRPLSLVGWLALGLADRRRDNLAPFIPLCCDNMASNGRKLRSAVAAFAGRIDPALAQWIEGEVLFPDTMVDSITPASDRRLRDLVCERTGLADSIPVSREAYSAWVIEDVLPPGSPALESVGVTLAADVSEWEQAKLRILNGAHSTLAYLGLLAGHETISDAMADPLLSAFVEQLIGEDIAPTLSGSSLDLRAYAAQTLQRFRNPAIRHQLAQIAWDGSQKLPYRLLDTITEARSAGRPLDRLAIPVAAWALFLRSRAQAGTAIVDPLADELAARARGADPVRSLLQLRQIFPASLAADPGFRDSVVTAAERLAGHWPAALGAGNGAARHAGHARDSGHCS